MAWLNGDRLVLVARKGFVTLVSPIDVLHEWDVRELVNLDSDRRLSQSSSCDSNSNYNSPPIIDTSNEAVALTDTTLPPGELGIHGDARRTLNVVATHEGRFFVGGSHGQVLVFEQGGCGGAAGGGQGGAGRGKDAYLLTRVVSIFDGVIDVVELRPAAGAGYRWVGTPR